jgi:hypothetical protein
MPSIWTWVALAGTVTLYVAGAANDWVLVVLAAAMAPDPVAMLAASAHQNAAPAYAKSLSGHRQRLRRAGAEL